MARPKVKRSASLGSSSGVSDPSGTATATFSGSTGTTASVPSNCLKKNQIAVGWLPSEAGELSKITSNVGGNACFYGQYSQITSTSYDDSQLTQVMDEVKNSGAIFIPSVMPTIPFKEVSSDVGSQVASSMAKFTKQGVEVWLRFAHEMNYYATSGTYSGSADEFITAWKNVAQAIQENVDTAGKVKMFWSPNNVGGDSQKLIDEGWWPGPETVDIVGIDIYPDKGASFTDQYGSFYDMFSDGFGKPFVIGETGSKLSDPTAKQQWLEQVSSEQAKSSAENYVGFSWFEYTKDGTNFRVATDGQEYIAQSVFGSSS